ncbi:aminocarboxymuconate-semialdehyde decarboxylase [Massilia sp. WF1]|uniref:amidohydrolase family protein n=1 Tax=unclassified Massilia TaxID=2609279 RepID=UPI00068F12E4|nr:MULTISPECIES: amidohydrolase family protein [unclassified Massilia]ALK95427.1 aminocarboxymuconate-semialdehyde decarboxylase [Massilia sp. WG5]KNZ67318.1 aminocarboxymuconate-semialdehyde decarboxylase [Massilia sp. WF1]
MSTAHQHTPGCGCGIDVHAHVIPHDLPRHIGNALPAGWPSMAPAHACHRHVMIAGKVYRTVSERAWSPSRRIEDMATMDLAVQAISPMPELLSYWMEAEAASQLLRYMNEQIAEMAALSGGRLVGMGAVPLQDLDLALGELDYVVDRLGFRSIEVGSNINGKAPGSPEFIPFFEACAEKGVAVFVHALKPAGTERLVGPEKLLPALAYPTDVGLAAASVLSSNLVGRLPALKMAFSHGGGTLASLLPRLEQARKVFPALLDAMPASPSEQARRLFYDTLVFDAPTLRHLIDRFGDTQLMIGTDYPFAFHDARPVASIAEAVSDAQVRERLVTHNAARFLGLEAGAAVPNA